MESSENRSGSRNVTGGGANLMGVTFKPVRNPTVQRDLKAMRARLIVQRDELRRRRKVSDTKR